MAWCRHDRTYTEKHIDNCQSRLRSAKLIDNNIFKLTSYDGFFNSSLLLDSTWLKGKITNNEYRQAIEQINQRIGRTLVGTSNNLPINQIPITQSTILAIEELNAKYPGRIHFVYKKNE
ncbi:unnamed protein product [Rotaria sordida]|uniref:Uncharacterized protein n=1 Tax=Rotaria sordida TaxID=392033 RepID=A0A814QPG2_9BILA|nr:unnamed protein product [Rotaria sordida]CAF1214478.1 unnamed protein product [Rotaria sordida]CAF3855543.1 unnamed protein product [Rotaria sordida]CAF3961127.1 unnamed protein product [Rotaria sordida]